jgi:hypothetical protein
MWSVYNAVEKIEWFYEPGAYGMGKPGREAIYAWMKRWLKNDQSGESDRNTLPSTKRTST